MDNLSNGFEDVEKWLKLLTDFSNMLSNIAKPIIDNLPKLIEISRKLAPALAIIQPLGACQFVYWDALPESTVENILTEKDTNRILEEFYRSNDYRLAEETFRNCLQSPLISPYKVLFLQVIDSYHAGNYALAALGLISISDGMLSDVSENSTHYAKERVDAIMKKINSYLPIEAIDYSTMILTSTLFETCSSLWKSERFEKAEPTLLNRNWLIHGRSRRQVSKLDCIKIINYLYGIILLNNLLNPNSNDST